MSIERIIRGDPESVVTEYLSVQSIEFCEWTRTDMVVEPEMHIVIRVHEKAIPAVIRLGSRAEVNQVIQSLRESRDSIWPKGGDS